MLRIAVCDDEENQLSQITLLLHAYLQSRPNLKGQVPERQHPAGKGEEHGEL